MLTKEKILANKARREAIEAKIEAHEAPIRARQAAAAQVLLKNLQRDMNKILIDEGCKPMNCV